MNLHAIRIVRKSITTNHHYDFVLDDDFFGTDENDAPDRSNYGALVTVWVEDDQVYGVWVDDDGIRWKITVYEYNNDHDISRIIANGDGDFTTNEWWVDSGHIP